VHAHSTLFFLPPSCALSKERVSNCFCTAASFQLSLIWSFGDLEEITIFFCFSILSSLCIIHVCSELSSLESSCQRSLGDVLTVESWVVATGDGIGVRRGIGGKVGWKRNQNTQ